MSRKMIILGTIILGIVFALVAATLYAKKTNSIFYIFPFQCDVSRRLSAPKLLENVQYSQNSEMVLQTALLVRTYGFDLNFLLFIVEKWDASVSCIWNRPIWSSHDYDPNTARNFHEDLNWSKDATVIAVIIDGEYVFAYDFVSGTKYEDENEITQLIEIHNKP